MSAQQTHLPEYQPLIPTKLADLVYPGAIFHELTVLSISNWQRRDGRYVDVICSCGKKAFARAAHLVNGKTRMCVPCAVEIQRNNITKVNKVRKAAVRKREKVTKAPIQECVVKDTAELPEEAPDRAVKFSRTDRVKEQLKDGPRTFDELIDLTNFSEDTLCSALMTLVLNKKEVESWNVEINDLDFTRWYRLKTIQGI